MPEVLGELLDVHAVSKRDARIVMTQGAHPVSRFVAY